MKLEGGCYCGAVRYRAEGEPAMRAQCHCRECQYITGGGPNYFMMMPEDGFEYAKGEPARFTRSDIENPVIREFCGNCGTHLATRVPGMPMVVVKVGTLDNPAEFGWPEAAIFLTDMQPFHIVPEGVPRFDRVPG
jgi:hypothetical protein